MDFNDYQERALRTAIITPETDSLLYASNAANGEAGELANRVKKIWRDRKCIPNQADIDNIQEEIGGTLWYLNYCTYQLSKIAKKQFTFEDMAIYNLKQLSESKGVNLLTDI